MAASSNNNNKLKLLMVLVCINMLMMAVLGDDGLRIKGVRNGAVAGIINPGFTEGESTSKALVEYLTKEDPDRLRLKAALVIDMLNQFRSSSGRVDDKYSQVIAEECRKYNEAARRKGMPLFPCTDEDAAELRESQRLAQKAGLPKSCAAGILNVEALRKNPLHDPELNKVKLGALAAISGNPHFDFKKWQQDCCKFNEIATKMGRPKFPCTNEELIKFVQKQRTQH